MQFRPYAIAITDEQLEDLARRLRHTRWPDALPGMDWADGTDLAFLRRLADYWLTGFDWRRQEARLNALPQFLVELDGLEIHLIHQRGTGDDPLPLVLTHGWPGTGFDLERLIPLLSDPGGHGADPADSFDVVVPSLPGYGFSQRPEHPGIGPREVAVLWDRLMRALGYERFGVQAGDWGAAVSLWLAQRFPDDVAGVHVNFIPGSFRPPLGEGAPPVSPEEERFLQEAAAWFDVEGGYHRLQSTRPQTPAYALTDSPVGLAAWIVEKLRGWSDCGGDVERVFSLDAILTDVSLYWFTGTIGSSMRFYRENRLAPQRFDAGERVRPPLGVAAFPQDLMPPRSWVERVFDLTRWTRMPRGGHFGPVEDPEGLAQEIREFFRPLRATSRPSSDGGS